MTFVRRRNIGLHRIREYFCPAHSSDYVGGYFLR
jgi:hypothetical protein